MGLFKKKAADAGAAAVDSSDFAAETGTARVGSDGSGLSGGKKDSSFNPTGADAAAAHADQAGDELRPSASGSIGDTLHDAKETTVSGASVAVLILWTIAVTGWTGFQIVQNGLTWGQLERQPFDKPGNPKVPNNGDFGIRNMEIRGLWAIMAVESVLLLAFISLAIGLMWVPYIGACKQHRRARRTKRSFFPWLLTLMLVACAWFKLVTLSSTLNKMNYQGTWCATNDNLDIKYTFNPQSAPAPTCNQTPLATNIRRVMVYAMLTIAFHMLMFFWHQPKGTIGKAYGLLPAALVVALLVLMPVASLMNMYYTQNAFTRNGNFTFTAELIVALIAFITSVWLSLYMGWAIHSLRLIPRFTNTLLACCGKQYEDVYYEKEQDSLRSRSSVSRESSMEEGEAPHKAGRKSYSLRAASKSVLQQYFFMTQLPSVFGFVSPMITFFALGVQNWWIKFDIILGAVLIFIYMLLCGFHRKLMAPSKHRPAF